MTLTTSHGARDWRLVTAALAMILATAWFAPGARAQLSDTMSTAVGRNRAPAALPQKPAAPPALPGAQSSGSSAPAPRVPLDMPPTEALFDGVNRGDIEAVRDALARGAELNARNILGITATEMAIDLGRNDIAFLLLSMRGADRTRNARVGGPGSGTSAPQTTIQTRAQRPAPQPRATPARAEPAPGSYANDPGTPAPNAGFLGFDERSTARYR
jgi:hypothetical protein